MIQVNYFSDLNLLGKDFNYPDNLACVTKFKHGRELEEFIFTM
jgi:hypothetical protein